MDDKKDVKLKVEVEKPTLGQVHRLTSKDVVVTTTVETPKDEQNNNTHTEA